LLLTEEHPAEQVPFPVVVLLNALGRLVALPVAFSYTLPETLSALKSDFKHHRRPDFHYPLGHGLRPDAIHRTWNGEADALAGLVSEASLYLYAVRALLVELTRQAKPHLVSQLA